ncbi:MAG: hypothetical protein IJH14_11710 [Solobacterium sp.]|nr:hypothetical protein [Solobacterium sp.]
MRSQVIRIRNLPADITVRHSVHVKPTILMVVFLLVGVVMLFMKPYLLMAAMTMILLALFSLFIMPDRKLCDFTDDYLVLYNQPDRSRCYMVCWEDIVSWRYEWHASYDQLVILLSDGSTQMQEMYSRLSIQYYMNQYAKGKEVKNNAIKRM